MRRLVPASVVLAALLGACASPEEVAKSEAALSHPGPWDLPASVASFGDTQHVTYTGAGPWVGPSGCGGGLSVGAGRLRDFLATGFPQVTHVGGYSCRTINGDSTTMSVHATGRALDIHIPLHGGEADNDLGDPVAHWLIGHAEEIGIQYIIWDRWTWSGSRAAGSKERAYTGAHPHHDHLHVELSVEGGRGATRWFSGPMEPPEPTGCAALPGSGGVIEETSACFAAYGPATYWRHESVGHGGSLLWTNAFQSDAPSNWARWHVELRERGEYAVEVWAEPGFAVNRRTRYELRHGGAAHSIEVDLAAGAGGWLRLGVFDFDAGGGQHLSVHDDVDGAVAPDQHIPADAIRLTRVVVAPEPTPEPTPAPVPSPDDVELRVVPITVPIGDIAPADGGDPRVDDDPLVFVEERSLRGGCSASPARGSVPLGALVPLALLLARMRRRASRSPRGR